MFINHSFFTNSLSSSCSYIVLFSGSIIIEQVFGWPGVGNITYQAILNRDYPLLMGAAMFYAVLTIFSNLLTDIIYAVADPRIRLK